MGQHKEAYALMTYQCRACGAREVLWNSRDGVTPFGIDCRVCGETADHVEWGRDRFAPNHEPAPGDRVFVDLLPEQMRAIMRRRLEQARGSSYEVPQEEWQDYIDRAAMDFRPGEPHIVVAGTDEYGGGGPRP